MTKTTKNSYHHGNLRQSLINAAIVLLPKKGVQGLSLREVAKAAGVSHTAPYRHFKDKNALLGAIALMGFEKLSTTFNQLMLKAADDPEQQLTELSVAYVEFALQNPDMIQLMFGGVLDPEQQTEEFCNTAQAAFNDVIAIIQNGQAKGLFKMTDSFLLALTAWSLGHGLMVLITTGHLKDITHSSPSGIRDICEQTVNSLLNGILK